MMISKLSVLLLCLGLAGCAFTEQGQLREKYSTIYANAVNWDNAISVVKNEDFQDFKDQLSAYLKAFGYTKVIYVDPAQGLLVLAKEDDIIPSQIIVKYTRTIGPYNIRVDLVRASSELGNYSEVDDDLKAIAEHIRNE